MLWMLHVGSGHELVEGAGGFLFLGATASIGDMQRVREAAKQKQATSFTINSQGVALNAFYNALQACGGAVNAVRHAARPWVEVMSLQDSSCLQRCNPTSMHEQPALVMQTFAVPHGAADPLRKVADLLGVECKTTWRTRLTTLWTRDLRQFVQFPGEVCLLCTPG
jgi:hypothetical protein